MTPFIVEIASNYSVKELSEVTRERFADILSTIAADILKGESKGRRWEIRINGQLATVNGQLVTSGEGAR